MSNIMLCWKGLQNTFWLCKMFKNYSKQLLRGINLANCNAAVGKNDAQFCQLYFKTVPFCYCSGYQEIFANYAPVPFYHCNVFAHDLKVAKVGCRPSNCLYILYSIR